RRKEPRYRFKTPLELYSGQTKTGGCTVDLSKRGLGIRLSEPTMLRSGQEVRINFRELQLYDKKLPLMSVPYRVIRVSPDGCSVQLVIDESSQTMKVIAFFNSIIEHNQDKLIPQKETLPSNALLERLHCMLLSRTLSTPIFISKSTSSSIKTPVIGVNLPLPKHIELFARLGHDQL
ncbi:PilZ domain-containing protein, partial [Vibrio parahaemolyticus]|nr:PilZ domain-containing protein [Vibrio parahaemolyticus]